MELNEEYNELAYYTLSHKGKNFIHQHLVDANTIQNADENTKPIAIVYALVGIYLHVVKKYTGKQVQEAHIKMAKKSKVFPEIKLPKNRGSIIIKDVLAISNPNDRDLKIHQWCASIWEAFSDQEELIITLSKSLLE